MNAPRPDPTRTDRLDRLDALVRRERASLVAVARSEGATPEEALEAVQDALCTFLTRDEPDSDHLVATLKTMVRNAARNVRRTRSRRARLTPVVPDADPASDASLVDDLVSHAEDVVRLRLCVAELCGIQRSVVMLRLLDERSGEDVAELLGLRRGHVDVLVHRARAALHVCMHGAHAVAR